MLYGAGTFLSQLDQLRTVAIAGAKGSGKDLLSFELSEFFLKRDYKFTTNQRSVWNDPMFTIERLSPERVEKMRSEFGFDKKGLFRYVPDDLRFAKMLWPDIEQTYSKVYAKPKDLHEFYSIYGVDEQGWYQRIPDMRKRVLVLSEGGRYLRQWVYFENMYEFTRKTDNYIFIPSIRLPHDDLCEMIVWNVFPLRSVIGRPGGLWYWRVGGKGLVKPIQGTFFQWPTDIGLYDTQDLSTSPTEVIEWFERQIAKIQQDEYGRDGLQAMVSGSSAADTDSLSNLARQFETVNLSLSSRKK